MPFGQVVLGAPGAGKTTYCAGVQQFHRAAQSRPVAIVNLDPANDDALLPYDCAVSITQLMTHEHAMESQNLGPNGAFLYVMEHLERNMDWLEKRLLDAALADHYFVFDFPGQVELYIHHPSVRRILEIMTKQWDFRLVAVNLVDSIVVASPTTYVSALVLCLSVMIHLELPHVNVLSKWDLVGTYGELAFPLEFFTDVQDLTFLQRHLADLDELDYSRATVPPVDHQIGGTEIAREKMKSQSTTRAPIRAAGGAFGQRFRKLTAALCELVEDFQLVSFLPLDVQDKESMYRLALRLDKACGYAFGTLNPSNYSILDIHDAATVDERPAFERQAAIPDIVEHR